MKIRLATPADCERIARFNDALIRDEGSEPLLTIPELEERMRRWIEGDHQAYLFLEDERAVGYALFWPDQAGWYLRQFFVEADSRRSGVGTRCFALLREEVVPADATIYLDVVHQNERGQAFWRSLGFESHAIAMEQTPTAAEAFLSNEGPPGR